MNQILTGTGVPQRDVDWPHKLLTPDGRRINVPNIFQFLKTLQLVKRDRDTGLYRLRPIIYEFLESDYDQLMTMPDGTSIRRVLGKDLSGVTTWLRCTCPECTQVEEDADHTPMSGHVARQMEANERKSRRFTITVNGVPLHESRRRHRELKNAQQKSRLN